MITWTDDAFCKLIEATGADMGAEWKCRRGHVEPDEDEDFEPFDFYQARTRYNDGMFIVDFDSGVADHPWEVMRPVIELELSKPGDSK